MSRTIRLALIIICILVILPVPTVKMTGIAVDNFAEGPDNMGLTNTVTWNQTVSGTNTFGYVGCLGDNITGGVDDLTGGTWNGSAVTLDQKYAGADGGLDRYTYLYKIIGPSTGNHAIIINSTTSHYILCASVSYNGVKQTSNPVESGVNTGSAVSLTSTLMTSVDNSWVVIMAQAGGISASTGITERVRNNTYNNFLMGDSGALIHPAGNYSMTATGTAVGQVHIQSSIQPDTGGGASICGSMLLRFIGC